MENIAMKCTRAEYEGMRQVLLNSNIRESSHLFNYYYNSNIYLTNDFGGELLFTCVTTDRTVYDTFDRDIFLKACGIETPKILINYEKSISLTRLEIETILGYKIKIV